VSAALAVTLALWSPVFSRNPFALFYIAVLLSAWLCGIGPGLLAAVLSVAAITYFITPSFVSLNGGWRTVVQVGTFAAMAVAVSTLDSRRRRAVHALQKSVKEAAKAREIAVAANAAKDRFLAVLSHELRTPLTPALVAAQSMEDRQDLPLSVREDLAMIRRNIELEARLIDDLLDLTRITQNKLKLRPKLIDLHELIHQVLDICRVDADAKDVRTYRELNAIKPVVMADSARMNQVLWNLVKNAIKFTPSGGTVTVRTSGDEKRLRVEVIDTGIGIEKDALGKIFNAFEQAGENITREFGGLGLGLAITRALIETHSGKITAASEGVGKGSTFTVELNVAEQELPAKDAPKPAAPRVGGLRLLLVEDHKDTCLMMSRLLRSLDYDVKTAHSVGEGLAVASQHEFDLVVSDLGLPDASGLELMRQLRERYQLRGIALSGYGMEDDVARSYEAGFVTHLTKPIDFAALQQAIAESAGVAPQRVSA
jgi:hypothetical protein